MNILLGTARLAFVLRNDTQKPRPRKMMVQLDHQAQRQASYNSESA